MQDYGIPVQPFINPPNYTKEQQMLFARQQGYKHGYRYGRMNWIKNPYKNQRCFHAFERGYECGIFNKNFDEAMRESGY